ncbi:MAG: flagellar protein FlgN [Bdellovibrionota bacterium]
MEVSRSVAGSLQELHRVLEKLVALHRNLVDLLREEFSHMASVDVKGLIEASHAKEAILNEIWNQEQLRIQAAIELASQCQLDPNTLTLKSIAGYLPAGEAEKLHNAGTALTLLVTQAKELNSKNMEFAESSLSRIEEMKRNVLGLNNNSIKENYSNSGIRQPMPEQGGRLLKTEA